MDSPDDKKILDVWLTKENRIGMKIYGNNPQVLSYIHHLIGVEIDKMIITDKVNQAHGSNLIVPQKHGIINFLRRGKHGG